MKQVLWDSLNDFFELPHSEAPEGEGDFTVERVYHVAGTGGGHFGWVPSEQTRSRMSESNKNRGRLITQEMHEEMLKRKAAGEHRFDVHKDFSQVTLKTFENYWYNTKGVCVRW